MIESSGGKLLWEWDLNPNTLLDSTELTYFTIDGQPHVGLLSTGHDPRFEFPKEEKLLSQLSGARIRIVFHSAPMPVSQ